jgi:hypothetical protein
MKRRIKEVFATDIKADERRIRQKTEICFVLFLPFRGHLVYGRQKAQKAQRLKLN